eukprot:GHVU01056363.1.p1 GENE.GHVU01056363.1~~GHVU01056363.1.p1  ORF type:complete len:672 (+),score=34.28 GHVU01056363.1:195-2018(+)
MTEEQPKKEETAREEEEPGTDDVEMATSDGALEGAGAGSSNSSELSSCHSVSDSSLASLSSWESCKRRGIELALPVHVLEPPAETNEGFRIDYCKVVILGVLGAQRVRTMVGREKADELLDCIPASARALVTPEVRRFTLDAAARDLNERIGPIVVGIKPSNALALFLRESEVFEGKQAEENPGNPWLPSLNKYPIPRMVNMMPEYRPTVSFKGRRRIQKKREHRRARAAARHAREIELSTERERDNQLASERSAERVKREPEGTDSGGQGPTRRPPVPSRERGENRGPIDTTMAADLDEYDDRGYHISGTGTRGRPSRPAHRNTSRWGSEDGELPLEGRLPEALSNVAYEGHRTPIVRNMHRECRRTCPVQRNRAARPRNLAHLEAFEETMLAVRLSFGRRGRIRCGVCLNADVANGACVSPSCGAPAWFCGGCGSMLGANEKCKVCVFNCPICVRCNDKTINQFCGCKSEMPFCVTCGTRRVYGTCDLCPLLRICLERGCNRVYQGPECPGCFVGFRGCYFCNKRMFAGACNACNWTPASCACGAPRSLDDDCAACGKTLPPLDAEDFVATPCPDAPTCSAVGRGKVCHTCARIKIRCTGCNQFG